MTKPEVLSLDEDQMKIRKKKAKSLIPTIGAFYIKEEEFNNVSVYAIRVDHNGHVKETKTFKVLQKP